MEQYLDERDRVGVQDFVLLENFNSEEAFVDNLQKRFKENLIYTYIGPVLVSVNPYKNLPIYGADVIEKYRNVNFYEVPPHVFGVTDTALRSLRGELRDQCILISGESGAGKTEASKKVLQFIASTARQKAKVDTVKDKLLQSNPVLEAFGNAKTNRNDNSSRFGKYMDVEFDFRGDPAGGNILNYLLEKSRVVNQARGERNFHIFYQLLAGADDALLQKLSLKREPAAYHYLNQGNSSRVSSIDDAADFHAVTKALKVMEIGQAEQDAMMVLVAVVIHLGQLKFQGDSVRATIVNSDSVLTIAKLLGCPVELFKKSLLNRTIDANGDVVTTPLGDEEAVYARDALAKAIYERLFKWLVERLNRSLQSDTVGKRVVLGILDIYGFEIFEKNSFEQLCINYCNEKLQQLFIELTLKSEQDEYRREGIEWEPVSFFDNKIICDLVEEKYKGIISILDEECLRPGDATDITFLSKMNSALAGHPHFLSHDTVDNKTKKTLDRAEFRLLHYAGEVTYSVKGFLDKNNDLLFRDLKEAMIASTNPVTKDMFTAAELNSKKRPETAAYQFKNSLAQLVVILKSKEPSYIRCIKPTDTKLAAKFDRVIVSHQVKYLGLMENLRVRRAGFAYRRPYEAFLNRYKSLCPETWPHPKGTPKQAVQTLVNHLKYKKDDYRMGATKLFIRFPKTLFETEDAFQKRKHELATMIQANFKGAMQRRKYQQMRAAAILIQALIRRFLARILAARRRKSADIIRAFIKGFKARHQPENDDNRKYLGFVRNQFLLRLAKNLPVGVLDKQWPPCPDSCKQANELLRDMHMKQRVRKYCTTISPPRRRQFELKVLAESLFKDNKALYPKSISKWFVESRLTPEEQVAFRSGFEETKPPGEKVTYAVGVIKYDRRGFKPRDRILVITNSAIYLLDAKDGKTKHRLSFDLVNITITKGNDNMLLVRIPEQLKKEKGDLILECKFLIETLTWVVDTSKKKDLIEFEGASSLTTHSSVSKPALIEFTHGPIQGVSKGKNGLVVVVSS